MPAHDFIHILVCPETRRGLAHCEPELVEKLNRAIERGTLKNKAGRTLDAKLDGALVRDDRAVVYPIVDQIPMMLVDEAIPLAQMG